MRNKVAEISIVDAALVHPIDRLAVAASSRQTEQLSFLI
jgi:hypothetical protein